MTRSGPLCGPALAICGAVLLAGLAGWLVGAPPLPAGIARAFAAPAPHKLPRMIVPGAFSPDRGPASCDQPADQAEVPAIIALTCYASDELEDASPRDLALSSVAISWP